jgi:hypothetical protein
MAKVDGDKLLLSGEETKLLTHGQELELIPNMKGVYLLIDKGVLGDSKGKNIRVELPEMDEEKQQVIGIIRKSRLSDLVEGKFETLLNDRQKKSLLDLVAGGKVFVFKLNETYKKGVYRVKDDSAAEKERQVKESESAEVKEKPLEEYSLDRDGFLVTKNAEKAKQISQEYEGMIRQGMLKGIKTFEGNYYLIQVDLLTAYTDKIIVVLGNAQTMNLEDLSKGINASQILTKIICEFLKEEGELLERKKGQYTYIK